MKINLITENYQEYEFLSKVKSECSEILNIYATTNYPLLRGYKENKGETFYAEPRQSRTPKDSNYALSNAFNQYLASRGFEARRDNSFFCISRYWAIQDVSMDYKNLYIVLPINGFKYTYLDISTGTDLVLDFAQNNIISIHDDDGVSHFLSRSKEGVRFILWTLRYLKTHKINIIDLQSEDIEKYIEIIENSLVLEEYKRNMGGRVWQFINKTKFGSKIYSLLNENNIITKMFYKHWISYQKNLYNRLDKAYNPVDTNLKRAIDEVYEVYIKAPCYFYKINYYTDEDIQFERFMNKINKIKL